MNPLSFVVKHAIVTKTIMTTKHNLNPVITITGQEKIKTFNNHFWLQYMYKFYMTDNQKAQTVKINGNQYPENCLS